MEDNFENWKEILLRIFQDNMRIRIDGRNKNKNIYNKNHFKSLNVNEKELIQILHTLCRYKYLDLKRRSSENSFYYTINEKGIEIALKLQEHDDDKKFRKTQILANRVLLWLTAILSVGAIIQISKFLTSNYYLQISIFCLLLILFLGFGLKKLLK